MSKIQVLVCKCGAKYAACAAMQGVLSSNFKALYCENQKGVLGMPDTNYIVVSKLVNLSYRIADELLKQE